MKHVYRVLTIISIVIFLGSGGAIENDTVTLAGGVLQMVVSGCSAIIGALLYRMERKREERKHDTL